MPVEHISKIYPEVVKNKFFILSFLRIFIILLCVFFTGVTITTAITTRDSRVDRIKSDAQNLASLLAKQAETALEKITIIMNGAIERFRYAKITDKKVQSRLQTLFKMRVTKSPEIVSILVFEGNGELTPASYPTKDVPTNISTTKLFLYHKQDSDESIIIHNPQQKKKTSELVIPISQRISNLNGDFLGVIVVNLAISYFSSFYHSLSINPHDFLVIMHDKELIYGHTPQKKHILNLYLDKKEIEEECSYKKGEGKKCGGLFTSSFDGKTRFYALQDMKKYPLTVIAALSLDEALDSWKKVTKRQAIITTILIFFTLVMGKKLSDLLNIVIKREEEMNSVRHQLENMNATLTKLANEDSLTSLANRRVLMERLFLENKRTSSTQKPLTVIMIDIDFFKQYNDTYGHSAGDDCLRKIAECLKGGLKKITDMVARYGGEEFCILLPETSVESALVTLKSIFSQLNKLQIEHIKNPFGFVTLSAGVYTMPPGLNLTSKEILQKADLALYHAKKTGRNRVCVFDETMIPPLKSH